MKKTFLLTLFCVLLVLPAISQSSFTIFSEDGHRFWLIVNGVRQNDAPQHRVEVTGLTEPYYRIKIIFEDDRIPEINQNLTVQNVLEETDAHTTYRIRKHRRRNENLLSIVSWENVRPATPPGDGYSAPIQLTEKPAETPPATPVDTVVRRGTRLDVRVQDGQDEFGLTMEVTIPDELSLEQLEREITPQTPPGWTAPDRQRQHEPREQQPTRNAYVLPGYSGPVGCPMPMSDADFARALQTIKNQSFEEDRLSTARQIARNNCLLVSQVKQIIGAFSFEDSRLDFAKFAYDKTFDYGRYYEVNESFSFSSSVRELNSFIESRNR